MIVCGNCRGGHKTPLEVRECYIAAGLPVTDPLEAERGSSQPTIRQIDYIATLLVERDTGDDFVVDVSNLNRISASDLIAKLLRYPVRGEEGEITVTNAAENGVHTVDDVTLRLRDATTFARDLPPGSQVAEYLGLDDDWISFAFVVKGKVRPWKAFKHKTEVIDALRSLVNGVTA